MLIILSGLPASGKTTLARALAGRIGAMHVRIDTIEHNIRAAGSEVGTAGYMVAYGVAEDNLTLGRTVIGDCVNSLQVMRDAWFAVAERAGVPIVKIEVICSDRTEHRRRAETRVSDVPGLVKPTWQAIEARNFEDWGGDAILVDTATTGAETLAGEIAAKLGFEPR